MRGLLVLTLLVVYVTLVCSQSHHGHSHGSGGHHHIDSGFVRSSGLLRNRGSRLGSSLITGRRGSRFRDRQLNSLALFPRSRAGLFRDSGIMYNSVGLLSRGYPSYRRNSLRERRLTAENKRLMRRLRRLRRLNRKHLNKLNEPHHTYNQLDHHHNHHH